MSENKFKKTTWRGRFFRFAPLLLWVGVIFLFSSTQGAMSKTSLFIRPLLEWLFPNAPEGSLIIYHGYIRKSAHFIEYAVLAFWASLAFWSSSKDIFRRFCFIFSFLIVLLVASLDEFNQSFNVQRTGSIYDVFLDASGGLFMIFVLVIYRFFKVR